ncbi:MAG: ABC transporter permease subunit [Oscillospiraceae bacterium]|nr:ABC transporter permease subunit [Oscillospiraceae bacterium]
MKNLSSKLILAFSAAICLFLLTILLLGVAARGFSALSSGLGISFWAKWLPSHLLNTAVIAAASAAIALPMGLCCALYLVLYSEKRAAAALKTVFSALCSIPSAVYGMFGFFLFSNLAVMRYSVAAGIITVAVMLLGTAAQSCVAALEQVDEHLAFASRALGATELETVKSILLPAASNGIAFCAVLCLSKAAGESAALIFTCGTGLANIKNGVFGYLFSSGETLAVGIYQAVLNGELPLAFAACGFIMLLMTVFDILAGMWRGSDD